MNKPAALPRRIPSAYLGLLSVLIIFAVITIGFYAYIYSQTGLIQSLRPAIFIGVSFLLIPLIYLWLRRGQTTLAGIAIIIAIAIAYGGNEFAWIGLTPYHVFGGSLLIALAGNLLMPRRWRVWGLVILSYLICILLINQFDRFDRYNQAFIPELLPYALGTNLILVFALSIQVILQNPARSIRARLVGTFILLVVIPVAVTTTVASILNAQNSQEHVFTQLQSVAMLKENEINTWLDRLISEVKIVAPAKWEAQELLDLTLSPTLVPQNEFSQRTQQRFEELMRETGLFLEVFLVDDQGRVIITTDPHNLGQIVEQYEYFKQGMTGDTITPPSSGNESSVQMIVAIPVRYEGSDVSTVPVSAVLAASVNIKKLDNILASQTRLGPGSETYLVSSSNRLATPSLYPEYKVGSNIVHSHGIYQALDQHINGQGIYPGYHNQNVIGVYRWMDRIQAALLAEQTQSVIFTSVFKGIVLNVGLMMLASLLTLLAGVIATNRITAPLARLAMIAERIAAGEPNLSAEVGQLDEVGNLARSVNTMNFNLQETVAGLEHRIRERTDELERRSNQLQIAAEIARDAVLLRDMSELLSSSVDLIHDRFDYYHVGIFLLDERGEYIVLAAATGEAGRILLEKNTSLIVGESSLLGDVALSGRIRVIGDIAQNPYYAKNPLLPDTISEAALPLKAGSDVIGVLDVHSTHRGAFTDDVLYALQVVTDLIAIAIQNARLIQEMKQAVQEMENVYGSFTQKAWQSIEKRNLIGRGYQYQNLVVRPAEVDESAYHRILQTGKPILHQITPSDEGNGAGSQIFVPIKLRGQTIGGFELLVERSELSQSVISTYEEIADRLGLILENARLLQEAQTLAQREQQINLISSQVRSSINLESVLQSTVQELGKAFGASRVFIQLGVEKNQSEVDQEQQGESQ